MEAAGTRGFGDTLRQARDRAGRTTAEVAATTRIQEKYVVALEAEEWEVLPSGVIGRGFVRVLAREYGEPAAAWVDLYRAARGEPDDPPDYTLPEPDWTVKLRTRRRLGPVGAVVLLLVGCAVGVWIWQPWAVPVVPEPDPARSPTASSPVAPMPSGAPAPDRPAAPGVAGEPAQPEPPARPAAPAPAGPPTAVAPEQPEPSAPERSPEPAPVAAPAPGAPRETPAAVSGPHRLEVRAVERTWIRVRADGGQARDRVLRPGEVVAFTAGDRIEIKTGNAGGIRLAWDGEALKVPGEPGQVRTLTFPGDLEALRP